jgi:hypothetical protein
MDSPVDILPHLQRLETLRPTTCVSPSIHQMPPFLLSRPSVFGSKVCFCPVDGWPHFPALEECSITFPHHAGAIQALQPVTMPSCSILIYSNDLSPLTHFHLLVTGCKCCEEWTVECLEGRCSSFSCAPHTCCQCTEPDCLHLDVQCSEQLLVYILRLLPNLEYLWLGLASPDALSEAFFQAFILGPPSPVGGSEVVRLPRKTIAPLCTSLEELHLHYKRWLRGTDKRSLLLAFADIAESRQLVDETYIQENFELQLEF